MEGKAGREDVWHRWRGKQAYAEMEGIDKRGKQAYREDGWLRWRGKQSCAEVEGIDGGESRRMERKADINGGKSRTFTRIISLKRRDGKRI
jgi:hypothetical protein